MGVVQRQTTPPCTPEVGHPGVCCRSFLRERQCIRLTLDEGLELISDEPKEVDTEM